LRPVIALLIANLGLSTVLTVLMLLFRDSVVDHQLAHLSLPAGTDIDTTRALLRNAMWLRVAVTMLASVVYVILIGRLRAGSRWAYVRAVWISVVGLVAVVYLGIDGDYPMWIHVEQVLQAVVLVALVWFLSRPALRAGFKKQARTPAPDHDGVA